MRLFNNSTQDVLDYYPTSMHDDLVEARPKVDFGESQEFFPSEIISEISQDIVKEDFIDKARWQLANNLNILVGSHKDKIKRLEVEVEHLRLDNHTKIYGQ